MLTKITFRNFRAIQDASIELGPFNLLIGANGSGKSTVVQAIMALRNRLTEPREIATLAREKEPISLDFHFEEGGRRFARRWQWQVQQANAEESRSLDGRDLDNLQFVQLNEFANGARLYCFDSAKLRAPAQITQYSQLPENGSGLAGFLDYLRDNGTDRFHAIIADLHRCLPEFDDIGFDRPQDGVKSLKLRRTSSRDYVTARDLSEGTMFTLAILALAHQPDAPSIVCIEEPDRGIHPRLLEEVRNALYRLSFPESYQETRRPIQVVATTHSPHFLDLFKDNPEQVIVADKTREHGVTFRNLGRDADAHAILEDSLLGQAWTAGAIGGVPLRS